MSPLLENSCALLFFGIARHFADLAYPSIARHILNVNPSCDVYVHTFNLTTDTYGGESKMDVAKADEMLILVGGEQGFIKIESEASFLVEHNVEMYRSHFPRPSSWTYPTSIDNLIRQWHSIASVWKLMVEHEKKYEFKYDRVGLLRADVRYTHPINISRGQATIPTMMYKCTNWCGYNDRLFYGLRRHAEIWATCRFDFVGSYLARQAVAPEYTLSWNSSQRRQGLHSEDFLRYLLADQYKVPLQMKDMCFQRIRASGDVLHHDCSAD